MHGGYRSSFDSSEDESLSDGIAFPVQWYMDGGTPKGLADARDYKSLVTVLGRTDTLTAFRGMWNSVGDISRLRDGAHVRIFRDGVEPTWEDPHNQSGGKWAIRVPKSETAFAWSTVVLAVLGDELTHTSDVMGFVLSMRANEDQIHVWNGNCSDAPSLEETEAELRGLLEGRRVNSMEYHAHFGTRQWNVQNARGRGRRGGGKGRGGKGKGKRRGRGGAGGANRGGAGGAGANLADPAPAPPAPRASGKRAKMKKIKALNPWADDAVTSAVGAAVTNGRMITVWDCDMDGTECIENSWIPGATTAAAAAALEQQAAPMQSHSDAAVAAAAAIAQAGGPGGNPNATSLHSNNTGTAAGALSVDMAKVTSGGGGSAPTTPERPGKVFSESEGRRRTLFSKTDRTHSDPSMPPPPPPPA